MGRTYNWPGSGIEFKFVGDSAEINITEVTGAYSSKTDSDGKITNESIASVPTVPNAPYFNITVDGVTKRVPILNSGWLNLADGLDKNREHIIRFERSSEATKGKLCASQIRVSGNSAAEPTENKNLLFEFYGDSYTVGYGNLYPEVGGVEWETGENTDFSKSFSALCAKAFDADVNVIARSGKGIIKNNDKSVDANVSQQAELADLKVMTTDNPQLWDFDNARKPDVVSIYLGTNDTAGGCQKAEYVSAYRAFLTKLRTRYPDAKIICLAKPGSTFSGWVSETVTEMQKTDNKLYYYCFNEFPCGALYHPSVSEDESISKELIAVFKDKLGI